MVMTPRLYSIPPLPTYVDPDEAFLSALLLSDPTELEREHLGAALADAIKDGKQ